MKDSSVAVNAEIFRGYWDDGLIDLLAGLAIMIAGAGWLSELGPLAVLQAPVWLVLWNPLRKSLVEPRAGYVRFSLKRRKRNARSLLFTVALGMGFLVIALVAAQMERSVDVARTGEFVAALPAGIVATMAVLAAWLTSARRFLVYAALLVLLGLLTIRMGLGPEPSLAAGGAVMALAGVLLLARFLRDSRDFREHS